MAEAISSIKENVLQCPICIEIYTRPKVLPCQHTFCERCLQSYIVSKAGSQTDGLPCPVCKQLFRAPAPGIPTDRWAERFLNNLTIVALLDELSKPKNERSCDQCSRGDNQRTAVGWCRECEESLCQRCCGDHKLNSMSSSHTVIRLDHTSTQSSDTASFADTSLDEKSIPHLSENPSPNTFHIRDAQKLVEFSGKVAGDTKSCCLTGVCFTEAGDILLVDNNNSKVKLFTATGQLIHQLQLSSGPWDVTVIDRTTAAVTLPNKEIIQFISVTDKMTTTRSIRTAGKCWGITCIDTKLAVTCDPFIRGRALVMLLSMHGQLLQSISSDNQGRSLQGPCYVSSTVGRADDTPKLYVTDHTANTVLCFTLDGQCLFEYSSSDLLSPNGIAVDVEENVYVACRNTKLVLQVSPDGKQGRTLLDSQMFVNGVYGLCYEPSQERCVVTQYMNDIITMYQLV